MKVTVVMAVYNEEERVVDSIESLKLQTYLPIEIIVVDDGSIDSTFRKVSNIKGIRLIKQKHFGPGAARNNGASKARGEILVFVDADMVFDKDFIKNLVRPIIDGKSKGTFTKEETIKNWNMIWARCWGFEYTGSRKPNVFLKNYPNHAPVFRAILKSEFERVGGFDLTGYNDDWTLSKKLGYEASVAINAKVFHYNPETLVEVFEQARWIGKRRYKLGIVGRLIGLARASFPISLIIGVVKTVKFGDIRFFIFKLIYDFGISFGILEFFVRGGNAK